MHIFSQNVYEGLGNEILLGMCSENDENCCGFGMSLEAALTIVKNVQLGCLVGLHACLRAVQIALPLQYHKGCISANGIFSGIIWCPEGSCVNYFTVT